MRYTTFLREDNNGKTFPYNFIGDEAFLFKINVMRPYLRRMLINNRLIQL
jgi:hypothetical protein